MSFGGDRSAVGEVTGGEATAADADDFVERSRAAAYLWCFGGGLSFAVVLAPGLPHDFNRAPTAALAAGALAWGLVVLVSGLRFSENAFFAFTAMAIAMVTAAAYFAGSSLSPFAAMLFVWAGTYGYYFFSRVRAAVLTVLIGLGYGAVLALQPGNSAPVARWLFVMGTVIVLSELVHWLTQRTRSLARSVVALNQTLERRVDDQVVELTRMGELRRFLSPQVADTLLGGHQKDLLEPHRREIAVFFCDLRGFTAFTSEVEPEEVLAVIGEYYDCVGALLRRFEATIGPLAGDGVMAYFNDPVPCDQAAARAVELAIAVRSAVDQLADGWKKRGHQLGCGIGLAAGYATLGVIGFEGKRDYGPVGSVVNRAARLCDEAGNGQILIDAAVRRQLTPEVAVHELDQLELKGFPRPVAAYAVDD